MPFFSVIIPLFNKAEYVERTLNSVLLQSFDDFEVIIVNDGSTDNSLKIAESFTDDRIVIYSKDNKGVSTARNYGVTKANSNYIAFLDADDIWKPNHLDALHNLIVDMPSCALYCMGYIKQKSEKSKIRAQFGTIADSYKGVVSAYFKNSLPFTIAGMGAVAVNKAKFIEVGGFTEGVTHGEDIELWTSLALQGKVALHNIATVTHLINIKGRVSNLKVDDKVFPDFSQFNTQESHSADLKHYLDNNRYAIALAYRLAKDLKNYKFWKNQIELENLNKKQKLLLKLPVGLVVTLKEIHQFLLEKGFYISTFR
ncbi:glycosyltransferase family A protein [Croceibacter atlanticus]|uniref:glycosyltransferase family 2 protein n=1 Tax=Croceibacter atlanticus TaxID=313588 RepID=UPI0030D71799|tara:strand:- start:16788 stop:17723 length:936 start_codon:yes stop_codon:yes gene_type:complete